MSLTQTLNMTATFNKICPFKKSITKSYIRYVDEDDSLETKL